MMFDADPAHSWTINGDMGPGVGQAAISQRITPNADVALFNIKVALTRYGGPDSIDVYVQQDVGGLPGQVLEAIPIGGFSFTPSVVTAHSKIGPVLRAGVPYWISVVAGANAVVSGWNWNAIGNLSSGDMAGTQGGSPSGPWTLITPLTRGAFNVTGIPPALGRKSMTLDDVTLLSPDTLVIGGPGIDYTAIISNRSVNRRSRLATQGWIEQLTARRAGGGQVVACGTEPGVLPPGTCIRTGNTLLASNTGAGTGTLVAGNARAVVTLVELSATGSQILDARSFPVTLLDQQPAVLSVDVNPPDAFVPNVGDPLQLTATVQAVGGAPTSVVWISSNASVATVNSAGLVTSVSQGAALITAISTFDPTKTGTSLVSVATSPSFGNGVNVSPGYWQMGTGAQVQLAAQVIGSSSGVRWTSSNAMVLVVSAQGNVTGISPGSAIVTATSIADPSKSASSHIDVYPFLIHDPQGPTPVSTGATQPPANPLSVSISAQASGPSGSFYPGIARVDFMVQAGTSMVPIGSSTQPSVMDNGLTRFWT
ncbi:MAG: Ig-like domain-containing protein, partial [Gemmatimonadaceae bacterium]